MPQPVSRGVVFDVHATILADETRDGTNCPVPDNTLQPEMGLFLTRITLRITTERDQGRLADTQSSPRLRVAT
jgi:hypothetical protein